jgi:hypothetical protein
VLHSNSSNSSSSGGSVMVMQLRQQVPVGAEHRDAGQVQAASKALCCAAAAVE